MKTISVQDVTNNITAEVNALASTLINKEQQLELLKSDVETLLIDNMNLTGENETLKDGLIQIIEVVKELENKYLELAKQNSKLETKAIKFYELQELIKALVVNYDHEELTGKQVAKSLTQYCKDVKML